MFQARSYQTAAVDFLTKPLRPRALIVAPAGSGKTVIAATALSRICVPNTKVAWLANTREQVDQAVAALSRTQGAEDVDLIVACVASQPDLSDRDVVVVDECHHTPAASWARLASQCRGVLWGFTATPDSGDAERDTQLDKIFGGRSNRHTVPRSEVEEAGCVLTGIVTMHDIDARGCLDPEIDALTAVELKKAMAKFRYVPRHELEKRIRWHNTLNALLESEARNSKALYVIASDLANGHSVLVLVNSIEHGEKLSELVEGSVMLSSKLSKKKRAEHIAAFRSGEIRVAFATQLADEGLDVPKASSLVLLAGGRSASKLEQRAGRVMRPDGSKEFGVVHDFLDRGAVFAFAQARARVETYRKLGYQVTYKTS
jgi:superfamily II DNA or RNA helicase